MAKGLTIRTKLIIGVGAAVVVGISLLVWVSTLTVSSTMTKGFEKEMDGKSTGLSNVFQDKGAGLMGYAAQLAQSGELREAMRSGNRDVLTSLMISAFKGINGVNPTVHTVEVCDAAGIMLMRGHNPEKFGDDKSKTELFGQALKTKSPHLGLQVSTTTGKLSLDAVYPILSGDTLLGLVKVGSYPKNDALVALKKAMGVDIAVIDEKNNKAIGTTLEGIEKQLISVGSELSRISAGGKRYYAKKYPLMFSEQRVEGGVLVILTEATALEGMKHAIIRTMIGIGILILVAVVAVVTLVLRTTLQPLSRLTSTVEQLAGGDLTVEIDRAGQDEIGHLAAAMKTMVEKLRSVVGSVRVTADNVSSAANQLHATSGEMAAGTDMVASQAGNVATASEEMAATSEEIARNCLVAAEFSRQANDKALSGAEVVEATVTVMNRIAGQVQQAARTVEGLGTRSDQIGEIVGTIQDIADQTNLLALNAAIEAARAGEQGRGFAVVADEVRALAERTTKATREIGEMIKAIQSDTRGAVSAMEQGVREVESGTVEAARSGEALKGILEQIHAVSQQVGQIATAAEQQTFTTGQISSNMQQVTEVVQDTARGAQESATAAGQLAQSAEELQRLVGQFRLSA